MRRIGRHQALFARSGHVAAPRPVRLILPFLIFLSVGLLLLSRLNHSALNDVRWRLAEWMSPALEAAMVPLGPLRRVGQQIALQVDLSSELQRLKADNEKLSSWEWRARTLERKLADLEALTQVVREPQLQFVTGRVIADSSGAFVRTVIIDAGRDQNVRTGYPVINADGLVGRVVEVGADSARILLASDLNSRIPVAIGRKEVRAILSGDNGPAPRLLFLPPAADIAVGDDVSTSGTGGLFPRGLRIGKVVGDLAAPRVSLRADLDRLEYISILFHDDPMQQLMGEIGGARSRGRASNETNPGLISGAREKR